jgi:hypothetical protein
MKDFKEAAEKERNRLLDLQQDRTRWFSQEEYERLKFLDGYMAGYSEAMKEQRHLFVEYAGFYYRVADFSNEFGVQWVHIYDEPPSLHIDRVKFSSTTGIKLISFTEQEQSTKEDNGY